MVSPTTDQGTSPRAEPQGDICVSSLKKDWRREYGVERILTTVKCLLIEPNPDSALDAEAARLMQEDWERFVETARLWTGVHGGKKRPACFGVAQKLGSTAAPQHVMAEVPASCAAAAPSAAKQHAVASTLKPRPAAPITAPKRGLPTSLVPTHTPASHPANDIPLSHITPAS